MKNPFYISGIIPNEYFCDRDAETQWLVGTLQNHANVLLTSPRRMGKTQLIRHTYARPTIADKYYTFYVDIFPTTSLSELVLFLSKEIYNVLVPQGKSALDRFLAAIKSLYGSFSYNPVSGIPSFNIKMGDIKSPELTLDEIFGYLEKSERPCIFAIDEFQQIAHYPERNVEALLRSYIQKMNNCSFIYAGSDRHTLENMFNSTAKPFYNSAEQMYLGSIPRDKYVDFAIKQFSSYDRDLSFEAACLAYDLFEGHTYYVHNLLHNTFAYIPTDRTVTTDDINLILDGILKERDHVFSSVMNRLNYQQKETLVAIAQEGNARAVTSVAFIKKHSLKSPSSVQYAISYLLDNQILTYENQGRTKVYRLADRFLEKWVCQTY